MDLLGFDYDGEIGEFDNDFTIVAILHLTS